MEKISIARYKPFECFYFNIEILLLFFILFLFHLLLSTFILPQHVDLDVAEWTEPYIKELLNLCKFNIIGWAVSV